MKEYIILEMETPAYFHMKGNGNVVNLTHARICDHIHMQPIKWQHWLDRKYKGSPQNMVNKSPIYMGKTTECENYGKEIFCLQKIDDSDFIRI